MYTKDGQTISGKKIVVDGRVILNPTKEQLNGEKYYVDSFSDGNHTLTKQGAPVACDIGTFITLNVSQSSSNYVLNVIED